MVQPEILNFELVSISYLINVLCYSFDCIGIRIKFFHVLFYFVILLLDSELIKFSHVLFNCQFFLLSRERVVFSLMRFT